MASNLLLYPPDYNFELNGEGGSTYESALAELQTEERDTALKQSYSRRIAGQNAIDVQNRMAEFAVQLMPLFRVMRRQPPPQPVNTGTEAFAGGGRSHGALASVHFVNHLLFSGGSITPLFTRLTTPAVYMGTNFTADSGRFAGGWSGLFQLSFFNIDRLNYKTKRVFRTGMSLDVGLAGTCGGIGNKTNGYFLGGVNVYNRVSRRIVRLSYSNDIPTAIGALLNFSRMTTHNGLCSRSFGYACGGIGALPGSEPNFTWEGGILNIERFSMATEVATLIGATMATPQFARASMGNEIAGYMGGGGGAQFGVTWNQVSKFTFSGEVFSVLAATLSEGKICVDGTSSSTVGYMFGGETATSVLNGFAGIKAVEKLVFATEIRSMHGEQLYADAADQGAVCDYGAGFSY